MTTPADNSEFGAGASSRLLGTNDLQSSIDKFTTAVDKLDTIVQKMQSGSGSGSSQSFPKMSMPQGKYMWHGGASAPYPRGSSNGGSSSSGPPNVSSPSPMGGTNANGGGSGTAAQKLLGGGGVASAMGVLSSFKNYGSQQLPIQVGMNAYAQQAMLGVAPGMNASQANSRLYNQAFGTYNNNVNAIALSPQDAAQGQMTLNSIASSPFPSSTSLGRSGTSATNAFGYMNPSLGSAGSAQMAAQLYSGQTSMAMRQLGYGSTPRAMLGSNKASMSSAASVQSMLQRWYGQGSVSSKTLNAGLGENGRANLNLQALGLNPAQFGPMIQGYNKLFQQGVGPQKAQALFNDAAHNQAGAQSQLNKYGISNSDLQKMKNVTAVQTGRDSGVSGGFNDALSTATTGLQHFNTALNSILKSTGLGTAVGYGGGIGGVLGNTSGATMTSGLGSFMGMLGAGKLLGLGGAKGGTSILSKLLGSGAKGAADAGAGTGAADAATGAASGGLAGGLATGGLAVGGTFAESYLQNLLMKAGPLGKFLATTSKMVGNGATNPIQSLATGAAGEVTGGIKKMLNIGGGASVSVGGGGSVSIPGSSQSKGSSGSSMSSGVSSQVKNAVKDAEAQVGKPYVWGGDSPATSFDCSGLVEWAYSQAGVKLPRTSQQQWAALHNKSVPLNKAREGDIVFAAGSDGTATAPGHEALMISDKQIVEAPHTGANIRIRNFNPSEWQHAGRPSGSLTSVSGSTAASVSNSGGSSALHAGNGGIGLAVGSYGSSEETDNVSAALLGGGGGGGGFSAASAGNGKGSAGNANGSSSGKKSSGTTKGVLTPGQIMSLWTSLGGPGGAAANMARIAKAESGDRPSIVQQGVAAGVTGYGLYQITPTSGIRQSGAFGNLLNASNNTRAAISLYKKSGYSPWTSDPVGASLAGHAAGTSSASPGLALVGERGPEIVDLAGGESIAPNSKTTQMLRGTAAQPAQSPWMAGTAQKLLLANTPQNASANPSKCEINLNFPQGAIVIHTNGSASDVSNSTQQMIQGMSQALAENETLKQIAAGMKG